MSKGTTISFCGIDGTGKTTQLIRLVESLKNKGYKVAVTKEVGTEHSKAAMELRKIALGTEYIDIDDITREFIMAAMGRLNKLHIDALLTNGYDYVISDRGLPCHYAYCKDLSDSFVRDLHQKLGGLEQTDLTIFLDAPIEVTWARRGNRGTTDAIEEKGISFQKGVQQAYYNAFDKYLLAPVLKVDATRDPETTAEYILKEVLNFPIDFVHQTK